MSKLLKMDRSGVLLLNLMLTTFLIVEASSNCNALQYLQSGTQGIVECIFQDGFSTIAWYNSESLAGQTPFIRLIDGEKKGHGFTSGEFDIRMDGSLVINNVTLLHHTNFTVLAIPSEGAEVISMTIEVVVVVKPSTLFPVVDICVNETLCYTQLKNGSGVSCHIANSRPAIKLNWVERTISGDLHISSKSFIASQDGLLSTSRATTEEIFLHSSYLSLLVCKTESSPEILGLLNNESAILIENVGNPSSDMRTTVIHIQRYSTLTLNCSKKNISLIVWKKTDWRDDKSTVLVYAAFLESGFTVVNSNDYILHDDGSLLVPVIDTYHDGSYACIYESQIEDIGGTKLFDVFTYVPSQPVVQGCSLHQHCVLKVQEMGYLTCSVKGIRPKVQLTWKTEESTFITLSDHQMTTDSNGDVFDIVLKSRYQVKDPSTSRITIECLTTNSNGKIFNQTGTVDLIFYSAQSTDSPMTSFNTNLLWMLTIIIPLCLLIIALLMHFVVKGRRHTRNNLRKILHQGEGTPMTSTSIQQMESQTDLKSVFKKELRTKYKYQYDAVKPMPFVKGGLYPVDRIFVEGGLEKLISKDNIGGFGNWEKMTSYYDVTNLLSSSSTRTIIEGDPGYGKSVLTLQLAYDWCNCNSNSPLADLDILILLRLRQLGGVHSILGAIKKFILPKDSRITEGDIKNILQQSKSTLFILDGFDEFPEKETDYQNDIISTIRGEMFQDSFVILTSRSSLLPESYPPQTHRIRLTGFDSKARDAYIRKAVASDNAEAVKNIKRSLQENSVLKGLCQVPLFFVMFAHMMHERETFLKFKSVTSFFNHMITCFHSHMKNKMKDANVNRIDLHENYHAKLDEIAYLGLSGKNKQIVWMKEDLEQRLGKDFYNQYKSIGIFVEEEESLHISDRLGEIQYKTEVRFYHKLFCEWYAAHYLSRELMKHDTLQPLLEHMSPFDLQYIYRFACGLNSDGGNKVIKYLRNVKDGEKCSVLCILEQSGNFDQIKETVQDICSSYIKIDNTDSLLLQGSIVQLLEIGSSNQIPISFLWLKDCFNSVDLSAGSILLKSEQSIPALSTLQELVIGDRGRKFTEEELHDVITYVTMCSDLRSLRFCYSLMPQSIPGKLCSSLQSRKIQVLWFSDDGDYLLSHQTGKWEAYDAVSSTKFFKGNISAKTNLLKWCIKMKYKEVTRAVQVNASDPTYLLPIEKLFVSCNLQRTSVKERDKSARKYVPVGSYQKMFTDHRSQCKRYTLEGKSGIGKSTLALKMAYDWCEGKNESPFSRFDLLLLVHFSNENIPKSIYTEIKRRVLPRDLPLNNIDIKDVLRECASAVLVLDGLELNQYNQITENCDVRQIIRGKLLKDVDVITTCSFVPEDCAQGTVRLQLTDFDDEARDEYIYKVVANNDEVAAKEIKQKLAELSVLENLLHIPWFLSMYAYVMNKNDKHKMKVHIVKYSIPWFTECMRLYIRNYIDQHTKRNSDSLEKKIARFYKVSFDCLSRIEQSPGMENDRLIKEIGNDCYTMLVRLGLLREEAVVNGCDKKTPNRSQNEGKVTFSHILFLEWCAAQYVANHADRQQSENIKESFKKLHTSTVQRICSFACELNVKAVCSIINILEKRRVLHDFTRLLIFEYNLQADGIASVVEEICSSGIQFQDNQEEFHQKVLIHLLKIACDGKIAISSLWLKRCYSTVDLRGGNHLQLKSNLSIPVLTTLNELLIDTTDEGRKITSEELTGILQYSSKCLALKKLVFWDCLVPRSFQAESVSVLRSRNVGVIWHAPVNGYQLNLQSGQWERTANYGGGLMTDEDYQKEVKILRERWGK